MIKSTFYVIRKFVIFLDNIGMGRYLVLLKRGWVVNKIAQMIRAHQMLEYSCDRRRAMTLCNFSQFLSSHNWLNRVFSLSRLLFHSLWDRPADIQGYRSHFVLLFIHNCGEKSWIQLNKWNAFDWNSYSVLRIPQSKPQTITPPGLPTKYKVNFPGYFN